MSQFQPSAEDGRVPAWTFPDRLRKARESANLDQAGLGDLLAKKRSTISNWERGTNRPDELALRAIAHFTGVPLVWLQRGDDGPEGGTPITRPVTDEYHGYLHGVASQSILRAA